jgi:tRNA-specific 2-thiouridylase
MVAMSGGVDSSVAALLLREQGHEVVGVTMCLGVADPENEGVSCCGPEAVRDARRVCDMLDIRHYVFDFSRELEEYVVAPFIDSYRRARTPNPCVECNRRLKFRTLLEKARGVGFDVLATGHYARIERREGRWVMARPRDLTKDQTYFLYGIDRHALPRIAFPMGELTKNEARERARRAGLPVAEKAESQDICFVGAGEYRGFMAARGLSTPPGDIVDTAGTLLGRHTGIANYTIGQRRGLGIAAGRPLFVVAIDVEENRIVVGDKEDLSAGGLTASEPSMLFDTIPAGVCAAIRYAHEAVTCRASLSDGRLWVTFDRPQEAVTPGQSVVLYHGDCVVGGGIIEKAIR